MKSVGGTRHFIVTYRWEIALVAAMPALGMGFWVLWMAGPLELYGLAYNFAWWSVFVLLPALLMGVLYLRLRRRGYGWESLLLVATPYWAVLSGIVYSALIHRFLLPDSERWRGLVLGLADWGIPAQLGTVVLLAALYPAVQRLGQDFLRLTWQFLLAVAVIGVVVDSLFLVMQLRGLDVAPDSEAWNPMQIGSLWAGPVAVLLLLRLIRRASRSSLAHAFFMAALAFSFPWRHLFESSAGIMPETRLDYLALAALNVAVNSLIVGMTVFTAWLLFNFDKWGPVFRGRAVLALFGVHALGGVMFSLWLIQGLELTDDAGVLLALLVIVLAWLATFWAVYLVRVRHPAAPHQA